ncbi:hypothetical protein PM082_021546 [Marasmius tenuissimus]|nr:hypothetical protein PM082_021546 [Marasmius tenuissimus]
MQQSEVRTSLPSQTARLLFGGMGARNQTAAFSTLTPTHGPCPTGGRLRRKIKIEPPVSHLASYPDFARPAFIRPAGPYHTWIKYMQRDLDNESRRRSGCEEGGRRAQDVTPNNPWRSSSPASRQEDYRTDTKRSSLGPSDYNEYIIGCEVGSLLVYLQPAHNDTPPNTPLPDVPTSTSTWMVKELRVTSARVVRLANSGRCPPVAVKCS